MDSFHQFYDWMMAKGDPRVATWLLMETPGPIAIIFVLYLASVFLGPRLMKDQKAWDLKYVIIAYNVLMVYWSVYMFYEFLMSSVLAKYDYVCQPVDYSTDPLAIRMANVCWWFFFSKVIELLDTQFFILRKSERQVTFLHVYHHCTMIINWWLGVKFVAGGQSWFLAMLNSFVHIWMYSYYALAAIGPHMQKYLWWKRYLTKLQLAQFFAVIIHTSTNMLQKDCNFPQGFNFAVFFYAISLIILFSNFYIQSYSKKSKDKKVTNGVSSSNGVAKETTNGMHNNGDGYSLRSRSKPQKIS